MMPCFVRLVPSSLLPICLLFLAGCERGGAPAGSTDALVVPVAKPIQGKVRDYVYYTGRTNAKDAVTIVPRVTGYLEKMPFKEGAEVKAGTLLFEIDDRPYKAQLEAAQAAVAQNVASLKFAQATNERFKELEKKQAGAVSKQELDQYQAQEDQAIANLNLAKANLISAKLNLDWTKLYSPIDGVISRYYLTAGNLPTRTQYPANDAGAHGSDVRQLRRGRADSLSHQASHQRGEDRRSAGREHSR